MRIYPQNMIVEFKPTVEISHFRARGLDLNKKCTVSIPRVDALYFLKYFSPNFKAILDYPSDDVLVSAVMCTCAGREKLARHAVLQFREQTHEDKELVIINQGSNWITKKGEENITEVMVRDDLTNGAMRNIGDSIARGQYIVRWDDDDIFTERRIEMQLNAIKETGYPASSFSNYTVYIHEDNIVFDYCAEGPCVGLLMYKNEGKEYLEDIETGSDSIFASNYQQLVVVIDNNPSEYIRAYHGNNLHSKHKICGMYSGNKSDLISNAVIVGKDTDIDSIEYAKVVYRRLLS